MKLLVQLEGLLRRFGRVVPDAIAMVEGISRLQSRVRRSGSDKGIELQLFRAADEGPGSNEAGRSRDLLSLDEARGLKSRFGLAGQSLSIADDLLSLIGSRSTRRREQLLVLTPQVETYRRCTAVGADVVRICDHGSQTERWAPYADVVRVLEERLRVPTARPMARSVRTGGLLAIQAADPDAAWEKALALIRKDPGVDWVVLDDVLVLYTEDPDLEDGLESEPGVERLALAVHKNRLVLTDAQSSESEALYQAGRFRLEESRHVSEEPDQGQAWSRIRRRRLASLPAESNDESRMQDSLGKLVVSGVIRNEIRDSIAADARNWPRNARELISRGLARDALLDCHYEGEEPLAVTWMTGYVSTESDSLVSLHYRFSGAGGSQQDNADLISNAIAGILAINQWVDSIDRRRAVVHCVTLHRSASLDRVLESALFEDERNRLAHIVEFDDLSSAPTGGDLLYISVDSPARDSLQEFGPEGLSLGDAELTEGETPVPRVRLLGGNWCQSPKDPTSLGTVQAILQTLLT